MFHNWTVSCKMSLRGSLYMFFFFPLSDSLRCHLPFFYNKFHLEHLLYPSPGHSSEQAICILNLLPYFSSIFIPCSLFSPSLIHTHTQYTSYMTYMIYICIYDFLIWHFFTMPFLKK